MDKEMNAPGREILNIYICFMAKSKKTKPDLWDELDVEVKADVLEAIKELDNGGGKPHEEVKKKWEALLTSRALKSEEDIKTGKIYTIEQATNRFKK
jgi:hypothetical protein